MPANVRRVFTIGHGRLYGALDPKPLAMDLRTGEILTEFDCDGKVYQISYSGERIVMFAFEGVYGYAPSESAAR